jgi:membrane dipeptidase
VVGITSAGFYLGGTSTETYFRHLDHVAQLVGPQHVGIGLDYLDGMGVAALERFIEDCPEEWPGKEQGAWQPMAFFEPEQLPALTEVMIRKGYKLTDICGILGGNFLKLCKQVWH